MRLLNLFALSFFLGTSTFAFDLDYFAEARIGVYDGYEKEVIHATNGVLAGPFTDINFGLRVGAKKDQYSLYFEFNPTQDVEVESKKELATVTSFYLGSRYNFYHNFYAGLVLGYASFELEQGPGGVTFPDNPKTSGFSYGLVAGYLHPISHGFYIGADALYAFGPGKEDGPSATPAVRSIEIDSHYKISLNLGYSF